MTTTATTYFPTTLDAEEIAVIASYLRIGRTQEAIKDGFILGMPVYRVYYCTGCHADVGQPCTSTRKYRDTRLGFGTDTGGQVETFCYARTVNADYHPEEVRGLGRDRDRLMRKVREAEKAKDPMQWVRLYLAVCRWCHVGPVETEAGLCHRCDWGDPAYSASEKSAEISG